MRRGKRSPLLRITRRQADRYLLRFVRGSFRLLRVLPRSLSARWAERVFLTPPRQTRSRSERALLASARYRRIRGPKGEIATWRWGKGPAILLVHGWGGHAARLGRFVAPLEAAGFSVIAFDAPAHARSSGKVCDLADFVRAIKAVARAAARDGGPVVGIIGHSLGAAAAALAMRRGLRVNAAVLLAPISDPEEYTRRFASLCRIPEDVHESLKDRLVRRQKMSWKKLHLASRPGPARAPMLIFHDRRDAKVPQRHGLAIARTWPETDFVATSGLGHHKILRDPEVVARSVEFLRGRLAPALAPAEAPRLVLLPPARVAGVVA
jgi:pimeloyl-ACP methyl ester carboxylesterase